MSCGRASSGAAIVVRVSRDATVRVLSEDGATVLSLGPARDGRRRVECDGRPEMPAWVVRGAAAVGGFVALDGGEPPTELGRTTPLGGPDGGGESTLALRDGRALRWTGDPRRGRAALLGWETAGAFFEASASDGGWTLRPTVAGEAMGIDGTVLALLVAELTADGGGERENGS